MTFQARRVVTGHDGAGKAVVIFDDKGKNQGSGRPGQTRQLIWTTDDLPVVFDGAGAAGAELEDKGAREIGTTLPGGSVFRVVSYEPGVAGRVHRTDSIDYGVVISGEMDMELDDATVRLRAGDVVVQRGTIHNWVNNGQVPCVMAFILIAAEGDTAVG